MFKPQYKLTNKIVQKLTAIAEAKAVIGGAKLLPTAEVKLRRQALVRMTHNSTAIEGNLLNLQQVEAVLNNKTVRAPERDIYEVKNYLKAMKYIEKIAEKNKPVSERVILDIHKLVTAKTLPTTESGHYRQGPIYVINQRAGFPSEVKYIGPAFQQAPSLIKNLIHWLSQSQEDDINPVIIAGIAHAEIAAIHPFNDGNGRTARAVATLLLYRLGYDFRHLFALEDYYNKNRASYYKAIHLGKNYVERQTDLTSWLEYFVNGFAYEIENVKFEVLRLAISKAGQVAENKVYLTPAQLQILDFLSSIGRLTINDAMFILNCPRRTAQLYLRIMKQKKLIKAVGQGPSSAYVLP
ncbi:MAG: hypothetical protein UV05_C0056G0007 [candidate division CPR1 bacterium GW2011_GWA2_42_17]|uniref:Fido domain-containing protein n=1 Tax=candidate division CPR1 bacterium GW2011_GWA2_42_17 TaxID=1618341 RepID=A0A0G1BV74_9BACT|nr:MAG: hypothetical protein UV05_C0056G0007 [candidate division CPR1 bacterium GW2011_GWA2_42_17]